MIAEAPPAYQMPPVRIGQPILFFRYGERDGKLPFMAYCMERKSSTIKLKTVDGALFTAVRHIDDPRLKESPEQRKDLGAWDYTDEERAEEAWKAKVNDRLAALERQLVKKDK